ncbi:hypothetical protein ABIE18_003734 [Arthrobacter sp. 2762]
MTSTSNPSQITALPPKTSTSGRFALAVSMLGFFVITLDALIVNVALATIGSQLGDGDRQRFHPSDQY